MSEVPIMSSTSRIIMVAAFISPVSEMCVSSHGSIGDLVGRGISGSAAVQRVNRHSGSVGH